MSDSILGLTSLRAACVGVDGNVEVSGKMCIEMVDRITELEAELKHSKYNYMGAMEDCKRFEAENAALVDAARAVDNTAEFDGDISTVDTADLNNLSALLQSEEEI